MTFEERTGLTLCEAASARDLAFRYLGGPKAGLALGILKAHAQEVAGASRNALHDAWLHLLSAPGRAALIGLGGDGAPVLAAFEDYVRVQLADPALVRDLAVWALFFAARFASDSLQLDYCRAPTSESHLTGHLLAELAAGCETWRRAVSEPLGRRDAALTLTKLDLSILGGEQVTGADFGLILDLDGNATQPGEATKTRRVVPLIFQAKRYLRPMANISQRHRDRGLQRRLLARNACASAYIFYENGKQSLDLPLPPLVKPVEHITDTNTTNPAERSLEFATYLVTRLCNPDAAATAQSPDGALRMIYAKGVPGHLAIIASDRRANLRYQTALALLAAEIRGDFGQQTLSTKD
jgi:hypothetical protein